MDKETNKKKVTRRASALGVVARGAKQVKARFEDVEPGLLYAFLELGG
jgi:hypothetical protein